MRAAETAHIGVGAAPTSYFVLTRLHTNTAVGAVTRLIDLGVEGFGVDGFASRFRRSGDRG
jgi:type II secretory ATPase GspE/PulE/Tfp pilus assembly ATPase PilB-like protein